MRSELKRETRVVRKVLKLRRVKVFYDDAYALKYRIGGRYEIIGAGETLEAAVEDAKREIKQEGQNELSRLRTRDHCPRPG